MSRHNIRASKICKLDETGNSTVQVSPKIICAKGMRQLEGVANVTVIVDVNATGSHVRPVLTFPRVHFKNMLIITSTFPIGGANTTVWPN